MNDYSPREDYDDAPKVAPPVERPSLGRNYNVAILIWMICGTIPAYGSLLLIFCNCIFALVDWNEDYILLCGGATVYWLLLFGSFTYRPFQMMSAVLPLVAYQKLNLMVYLFTLMGMIIFLVMISVEEPCFGVCPSIFCVALGILIVISISAHRSGYDAAIARAKTSQLRMKFNPGRYPR